jgi:hypothetical protein
VPNPAGRDQILNGFFLLARLFGFVPFAMTLLEFFQHLGFRPSFHPMLKADLLQLSSPGKALCESVTVTPLLPDGLQVEKLILFVRGALPFLREGFLKLFQSAQTLLERKDGAVVKRNSLGVRILRHILLLEAERQNGFEAEFKGLH